MRVLLIDDDENTGCSIESMLKADGIGCEITDSGEDGLQQAGLYDYDAILLDLMLPDLSGITLLTRLRARRIHTPVLVLSGITGLDSKLAALTGGADDYLTKPFDRRELVARLRAVVRRARGHADAKVVVGPIAIDLEKRQVFARARPVHLTTKEFGILETLALRRNKTVSKTALLSQLYHGQDEPDPKIIDVFVCKVRSKLADATDGQNMIETVWGCGYLLREPATAAA